MMGGWKWLLLTVRGGAWVRLSHPTTRQPQLMLVGMTP